MTRYTWEQLGLVWHGCSFVIYNVCAANADSVRCSSTSIAGGREALPPLQPEARMLFLYRSIVNLGFPMFSVCVLAKIGLFFLVAL